MAGLYQRSVLPNTTSPAMQVAASKGAGGAIPRGAGLPQQQDQGFDAEKLGGLLGMMGKGQNGAPQDTLGLPNPDKSTGGGVAFNPAPSVNGEWGGVQASAFGPGVPTNATGDYAFPGAVAPSAAAMSSPIENAASNVAGQAVSGMKLNFDPSQLGGILGAFNFGG